LKGQWVLHPFLFAAEPVLALSSQNAGIVATRELAVCLLVTTGLAGLAWASTCLVVKDRLRAALIASLFTLLFFAPSRLLAPLFAPLNAVTPVLRFLLWIALFLAGAVSLCKFRLDMRSANTLLNLVALGWVILPAVRVTGDLATRRVLSKVVRPPALDLVATSQPVPKPDIYYVVLDGYARTDVLKDVYGIDNHPFLNALAQRGFFVAESSQANYSQTLLSLASSLNLDYLDDVVGLVGEDGRNRWPLVQMIGDSLAVRFLRQQGYTVVALASTYSGTELTRADVYAVPRCSLTYFQNMLLGTTPFAMLFPRLQYDIHRDRIAYVFAELPAQMTASGPVFVLAHIVTPHPPFVLDQDGAPLYPRRPFSLVDGSHYLSTASRADYIAGYRRQLAFVNLQLLATIDAILSQSAEPPVIIVQADHGPGAMLDWESAENTNLVERLGILNACLLPGARGLLYEAVSPVNTFRVLFNSYFGTRLELLPDKSYFSTAGRPYRLTPFR
jgi:hypothetical protein